jgi:DNA-binding LacI/PurR family transcriptional regulator
MPNQMKPAQPPSYGLPQRLSLVAQTAQSLRVGIRAGHWRTHLPGERQLCAHFQVGRTTLRAALEELQHQGWLDVAHGKRRRIKTRRSRGSVPKRVVGVLSPEGHYSLSSPALLVLDALQRQLAAGGIEIALHASRACFSGRPSRALDELTSRHPAMAWLILGSKEPMQRWFIRRQLPCMVLGTCAPDITLPSLDLDHRATCRHAAGVLWRKGHRRIALVMPRNAFGGHLVSEAGMREALHDISDAHLRILRHDDAPEHLRGLVNQALRDSDPPTAWLVTNPKPAMTVLTYLMHRGKRVPQEAAVISRDDDPFFHAVSPAFARYVINFPSLTRRIAHAIRQLAETGALEPKAIRILPKFIAGETV